MTKIDLKKSDLIAKLNADLAREYAHMHFYLHASITVTGLHREEFSEFFFKQSQSEMNHVAQFGKMILGLGGTPVTFTASFEHCANNQSALNFVEAALRMEREVIENYVLRMQEADELGGSDGKWVSLFLEDQLIDSRTDADHLQAMLK